ncbi:hypothetical protein I3842_07G232300 [Carya illinoinensis]|uniref:Transmembrane protein n=1 Tax=Carya illinoinensis TaxID=32201 RepID=A0A922JFH9_CARIL|nr:hypothetical protein I3842_07G232300 [Carya illinoinensis]
MLRSYASREKQPALLKRGYSTFHFVRGWQFCLLNRHRPSTTAGFKHTLPGEREREREREIMGEDEGSKRQPGRNQGEREALHQRRRLPLSYKNMAIGGILITAAIVGYLYAKKRPELTTSRHVAKTVRASEPADNLSRK